MKKSIFIVFTFFSQLSFSQQSTIDSLLKVLKTLNEDTSKVNTLNALSDKLWRIGYNERAIKYAYEALNICHRLNPTAEVKKGIANAYNNIGIIHHNRSDYSNALEFYLKALNIFEEIGYKKAFAWSCNNIGLINSDQGNYDKAIEYYSRALGIFENIEDKLGIATSFNNIANIYYFKSDYNMALELYSKSLKIKEEIGSGSGMVMPYNNIGLINYYLGDYEKALEFFFKALTKGKETGHKDGMAMAYNYIGDVNIFQEKYSEARNYLNKGILLAKEIENKQRIEYLYKSISVLDSSLNNWEGAYENLKLYSLYKDSVFNEESSRQITEMQTKYETEKKELQIENLNKDNAIKETEIKKQNFQKLAFAGGFGLMLILAFVILRGYKLKQKANEIITAQKNEVEKQKEIVDEKNQSIEVAYKHIEEKNTEILDSIRYAKRIQEAILPPQKLVKQHLEQSFILYKPKDIVAGDFYWMETVDNKVLFASVDCTGHGVPGAFMSILGYNGLNRCVKEFGLTQPAAILDKLCELVDEAFSKSEADIKDGMDIALCCFDHKNNILEYSGAGNSLYHIRENILTEFKADKQPVGKFSYRKPFTNHTIELQKKDSLYIFTDGYADQFGGPKGKKFKYSQFEKLLLSIQDKTMTDQRQILNETIDNWRGELEQIDDICTIGVRI